MSIFFWNVDFPRKYLQRLTKISWLKHSIYHYFEASANPTLMQQQEIGKGTFGSVSLKLNPDSITAVKTVSSALLRFLSKSPTIIS